MFDTTTTRDISKFFVSKFRIITYNSFEISLVVCLPNITTNHAITYTNCLYSIDSVRKMELKLKDPHLNSFPDLLTPILCKQNRSLDEDVKCIMTFPENT